METKPKLQLNCYCGTDGGNPWLQYLLSCTYCWSHLASGNTCTTRKADKPYSTPLSSNSNSAICPLPVYCNVGARRPIHLLSCTPISLPHPKLRKLPTLSAQRSPWMLAGPCTGTCMPAMLPQLPRKGQNTAASFRPDVRDSTLSTQQPQLQHELVTLPTHPS